MKRAPTTLAIVSVTLLLSGCVGVNVPEGRGTVSIAGNEGEGCNPNRSFPSIGMGTVVEVTDEKGEIIQSPTLNAGVPVGLNCVYGFSIDSLPERESYKFQVGMVSKLVNREDISTTFIHLPFS